MQRIFDKAARDAIGREEAVRGNSRCKEHTKRAIIRLRIELRAFVLSKLPVRVDNADLLTQVDSTEITSLAE